MYRCTVSGIPIPFDDEGNELCLLYLKYGRCRYRKKCKKSHRAWFPPLPVEEPPTPPPLPSTPPPTSSLDKPLPTVDVLLPEKCILLEDTTILTKDTFCQSSPDAFIPDIEKYLKGKNQVISVEDLLTFPVDSSAMQGKFVDVKQESPLTSSQTVVEAIVQNSNATLSRKEDCDPVHNNADVSSKVIDENEPLNGLSVCNVISSASKEGCALNETTAQKLEKIHSKVFRGCTRFQHCFKLRTTESTPVYQSGIGKMFKDVGAYFNNQSKKLEVKKSPVNKIEKHYVKLVKRLHWKINQSLLHKLADTPPVYMLKVDLPRVDFTRLRPYLYLLLHECFSAGEVTPKFSLPTPFTILVSDTLLSLFEHKNLSPMEAEKKLCSWGAGSVTVRKCVIELWNIIHRSSVSSSGVATEVMRCEQGVRQRNLRFLDYAYACSLAASKTKAQFTERENKRIKVSKSVMQGLTSARQRGPKSDGVKRKGWLSQQVRLKQKNTSLDLSKSPVHVRNLTEKHGDAIFDSSKDDFSNLSTEYEVKNSSNLCVTKRILGTLSAGETDNSSSGKRSRLPLAHGKLKASEGRITCQPRKRKRSRQFKGTSKQEKRILEAKFRELLA